MLDSNAQIPPTPFSPPPSPPDPSPTSTIRTSPFRFVTPLIITVVTVLFFAAVLLLLKRFNVLPFFNSPSTSSPSTTITVWGINDSPQTLQSLIENFEQANPDVKVSYVQENLTDYRQRLTTTSVRGQGPDVFAFHHSWVPMLTSILSPMPSALLQSLIPEVVFYPALLQPLTTRDGLMGLPLTADALGLFYNKTLLESAGFTPPTDWEELRSVAKNLTVTVDGKIERAGIAMGTTTNIEYWPDIVGLLLLQQGVDPRHPESELGQNTLQFYTNFVSQDKVWDAAMPPASYAFANGAVAMMIAPSVQAQAVLSLNPSANFAIAPVPQLYGTNVNWATFWAWGVSSQASGAKKQAAWKFLNYLSQKEILRDYHAKAVENTRFGFAFPRPDMADQLTTSPYVAYVSQTMPTARTWYLNALTKDFGVNDNTIAVYKGALDQMDSGVSAAEALKTVPAELDQIMAQYTIR